jgi:hypothetical protein
MIRIEEEVDETDDDENDIFFDSGGQDSSY